MTTNKDNAVLIKEFLKEFEAVRFNAVYFLEKYWNSNNPEKNIVLSESDKQFLYDKFKGVPFFNNGDEMRTYDMKKDKLKSDGLKDWEIDLKMKGM